MQQLVDRRKREVEEKTKVEHTTKNKAEEEEEEEQCNSDKSQKSPLPQIEVEEQQLGQGGANLETIPLRVKRTRELEKVGSRKKSKAIKSSVDLITFPEGDLNDIRDTVRDVTTKLLQQFEQLHKQALVTIRMGLHQLQMQATQVETIMGQPNTTSTILAPGTPKAVELVRSLDPRAVVILNKALTIEVEANKATINTLKKDGLNLAMLLSGALYSLQDSVLTELRAREQCVLNLISKKKVDNAQMFVEKTSIIDLPKKIIENNQCSTIIVVEACQTILELNILEDAPVDARIWKLTAHMHDARMELAKFFI